MSAPIYFPAPVLSSQPVIVFVVGSIRPPARPYSDGEQFGSSFSINSTVGAPSTCPPTPLVDSHHFASGNQDLCKGKNDEENVH
jgi:hypothetical protein